MASEIWQARIDAETAEQLRRDAEVLGLKANSDMVRAGLRLLHEQAAEQGMADGIRDFYRGAEAPLPIGVRRSRRRPTAPGDGVRPGEQAAVDRQA